MASPLEIRRTPAAILRVRPVWTADPLGFRRTPAAIYPVRADLPTAATSRRVERAELSSKGSADRGADPGPTIAVVWSALDGPVSLDPS
jgi:hypothetical protein